MGFNAKADPAKSAGIARATAANNSAALTVALVAAGALKTVDEAQDHFWKFYMELVPELVGETTERTPAAKAAPKAAKPAPTAAAEKALEEGGLTDAPGDFVVTFGKYKGKTIAAIHEDDPEYVTGNDGWPGLLKSRNEDVAKAAQAFAATL